MNEELMILFLDKETLKPINGIEVLVISNDGTIIREKLNDGILRLHPNLLPVRVYAPINIMQMRNKYVPMMTKLEGESTKNAYFIKVLLIRGALIKIHGSLFLIDSLTPLLNLEYIVDFKEKNTSMVLRYGSNSRTTREILNLSGNIIVAPANIRFNVYVVDGNVKKRYTLIEGMRLPWSSEVGLEILKSAVKDFIKSIENVEKKESM